MTAAAAVNVIKARNPKLIPLDPADTDDDVDIGNADWYSCCSAIRVDAELDPCFVK
jgi:hypothetical protein